MMKITSAVVVSLLLLGLLSLAFPHDSYGGIAMSPLGCCVDNDGVCLGCGESESCAITEDQCNILVDGNFTEGEACFEEQADGCGGPDALPGCCVIARGQCIGGINLPECNNADGIEWITETSCDELLQCQQATRNVPSLSQWGLIAVAAVIGIAGLFGILRRRVSA